MEHVKYSLLMLLPVFFVSAGPVYAWNAGQWKESERAIHDPNFMTLEQVAEKSFIPTKKGPSANWPKSGTTCLLFTDSASMKGEKDLVEWNPETDEKHILLAADKMIPADSNTPMSFKDPVWSDDHTKILLYTNTKRVWREHTCGDYWVLDTKTHALRQLGAKFEPSSLMFAKFSPDSTQAAYVYKNNIHVEDLKKGKIKQLTKCKTDSIINGTVDWAYEEEFRIRDGFKWSPDGKSIAYLQFDTEGVGIFQIADTLAGKYSDVMKLRYPKVGTTNSAVRVGVVRAKGGKTKWLDNLPGDCRQHYIPRFDWAGNSESVVFQRLNRLQNINTLWLADLKRNQLKAIFSDTDDTWVYINDDMTWFDEGKSFLWLSEMDGWRHFYVISRDGKDKRLITKGNFDVIKLVKLDVEGGWLFYTASPDHLAQAYLFRERLDGTGRAERLTPVSQSGTHWYRISEDANLAFHTYSSWEDPPVYELISLPDHQVINTLEDNAEAREQMKKVHFQPTEFFTVEIEPNVKLPVTMIKPYDFDASKKYPVLIDIYGEPMSQRIRDSWSGNQWHQYLAQQGYLILAIENRGTYLPLGRAWRHFLYRKIGILSSIDQAAALRELKKQYPYIDGDRVAVTGFSGGGSMSLNLLFRYPDLYGTAVAGGFISNQLFYNSIYQERFMGSPEENAENYRDGSPITHVENLQGNLLIYHGTQDDNCHYQNFESLVNELIKHKKVFTAIPYTGGTHNIKPAGEGEGELHNLTLKTWYLMNHVKPGPQNHRD